MKTTIQKAMILQKQCHDKSEKYAFIQNKPVGCDNSKTISYKLMTQKSQLRFENYAIQIQNMSEKHVY